MKKILWIVVLLILACLSVYYTFFYKTGFSHKDSDFRLKDAGMVDRIELEQGPTRVFLFKSNDKWFVNEELEANTDRIKVMLKVAKEIETISPVSRSEEKNVREILNKATLVIFYSGETELMQFRIGKYNKFIFAAGSKSTTPFRISSGGFPGLDLTVLFDPTTESWIKNVLLDLNPDEIQKIEMDYPVNASKSFTLIKGPAGQFLLLGKSDIVNKAKIDKEALRDYLQFFKAIKYERAVDSVEFYQNIKPKGPLIFNLKIITNNKIFMFSGYEKFYRESGVIDLSQFYIKSSDSTIITLRYSNFDPILVDIEYFLKK